MTDLYRGYLPDGKDRQHPVHDPDDTGLMVAVPQAWFGITRTWYAWPRETLPIYPPIGWPIG